MLVAQAFVSCSKWVARCPRPDCPMAECYGRDDNGTIGGLGLDGFRCSFCGLTCLAVWPRFPADIERLLAMRPIPSTRNWLPGETLADLLRENIEHGVIPVDSIEGVAAQMCDRLLADQRPLALN